MSENLPNTSYGTVLVTASSLAEATAIAKALVESHLAACVSLIPIRSVFQWQGELQEVEEWQLLIKTDLTHYSVLEAKICELHSYELPEIIALPIVRGFPPYLQWISNQVR